jgi:hypothetical protein
VLENQIRPFAREILPVVNKLGPSTQALGEAFPKLAVSFSVLNEFFNELAFNPGPSKAGFLFFLIWGNHNLNSVVSASDAHGPLGRSLLYFNCKLLPILEGAAKVNEQVKVLEKLLRPPTAKECVKQGLIQGASARAQHVSTPGLFSGLGAQAFGGGGGGGGTHAARAHAARGRG